jgi:hypothetical protein
MLTNGTLATHASAVVSTVATAVGLLRDLPTLVPVLQDLGKKHGGYGVIAEHYDVVGQALIKSLATALSDKFTESVKNSYLKMYTVVKDTMVAAAPAPEPPPAAAEEPPKEKYVIKEGDALPNGNFIYMGFPPEKVDFKEYVGLRSVIILCFPGAFTPI